MIIFNTFKNQIPWDISSQFLQGHFQNIVGASESFETLSVVVSTLHEFGTILNIHHGCEMNLFRMEKDCTIPVIHVVKPVIEFAHFQNIQLLSRISSFDQSAGRLPNIFHRKINIGEYVILSSSPPFHE